MMTHRPRIMRASGIAMLFAGALACDNAAAKNDSLRAAPRAVPIVVDSVRPMPEMLSRFREGLTRPDSFRSAATGREALVRRFIRAVERSDTAALAAMLIDRAEFAWLYFPHSMVSRPPYELDPALAWFQMRAESERSVGKLLEALGGRKMNYRNHRCDEAPQIEGPVRVWRDCTVTWGSNADPRTQRLFMSILESNGRFKFFSYANRL